MKAGLARAARMVSLAKTERPARVAREARMAAATAKMAPLAATDATGALDRLAPAATRATTVLEAPEDFPVRRAPMVTLGILDHVVWLVALEQTACRANQALAAWLVLWARPENADTEVWWVQEDSAVLLASLEPQETLALQVPREEQDPSDRAVSMAFKATPAEMATMERPDGLDLRAFTALQAQHHRFLVLRASQAQQVV
jgi:hypothetical protein